MACLFSSRRRIAPDDGSIAITVCCHSHRLDGKGLGINARHDESCYGCASCQALLDGGFTSAG